MYIVPSSLRRVQYLGTVVLCFLPFYLHAGRVSLSGTVSAWSYDSLQLLLVSTLAFIKGAPSLVTFGDLLLHHRISTFTENRINNGQPAGAT